MCFAENLPPSGPSPQSVSHDPHDIEAKVRASLNEKREALFVDGHQPEVGLRQGSGASRPLNQ